MTYDGLSLDVAITALNYMKAINAKKKAISQSTDELIKLEKEFQMYRREELVILNQSKDDAMWYSTMHKIDKYYCPIIKSHFENEEKSCN
ncbi:MAG: hypothetical protein U2P89_04370 [Proteiniphilum sp.]|uniref:hypothetical protein n=1 Tax=Proteiniphilum sp. TaxID=1926877 RepID=UPI002ABAEF33|nr:hypothetical protein [Proteiniphilum sp.]MDY9918090.1 hypothetical protein [Proteiniphilum sp.]